MKSLLTVFFLFVWIVLLTIVTQQAADAALLAAAHRRNSGGGGSGTPTLDAESRVTGDYNATTITVNHSQGTLTDGYAVVTVNLGSYSGATCTGVTYGGTAMTLAVSGGSQSNLYIYRLALNTPGLNSSATRSAVASFNNTSGIFWQNVSVSTWSGVNQSTAPNTAATTGGGLATTLSVTSTAATDVVLAIGETGNGSTTTASVNGTELYRFQAGGHFDISFYKAGTNGTVSATFTIDYLYAGIGIVGINLTGP
jgi:hypothetical protein